MTTCDPTAEHLTPYAKPHEVLEAVALARQLLDRRLLTDLGNLLDAIENKLLTDLLRRCDGTDQQP